MHPTDKRSVRLSGTENRHKAIQRSLWEMSSSRTSMPFHLSCCGGFHVDGVPVDDGIEGKA